MITATNMLAVVTGWRAPSADAASDPAIVRHASAITPPMTSWAVCRPASSALTLRRWVWWRPFATRGATVACTAPKRTRPTSTPTFADSQRFTSEATSNAARATGGAGWLLDMLRRESVLMHLAIERQAFPDDPWTALTVNGWLARATRAGRARHATRIARFIRFIRLNETVNLVKLIRLLMLDQPTGLRYVVAEAEDGEIAGYACLSAHGAEATIPMIAVRPDRQRRRIGTDLLMELIAMAAAGGCRDISLFVRADNSRARRLYRRTGFTEAGIQPGFYQPSGTDAVVVRLSIPTPGENPK